MSTNAEDTLPSLSSRQEYFDYLDGYAVDRADELRQARTNRALVKTFLLETVPQNGDSKDPVAALEDAGLNLRRVDDTLFAVRPLDQSEDWGLVELLERRHPVLYTLLESQKAQRWAKGIVDRSPWLDRVWLSAPIFMGLWSFVRRTKMPHRFSKLTFEHEARFEFDEDVEGGPDEMTGAEDEDESPSPALDDERGYQSERRASRCTIVERISEIDRRLSSLQDVYRPFHSITQLRIPAPSRGGHDFYFDGRATNRSDSFRDHRQQTAFVLNMYRGTTESAERTLWMSAERSGDAVTDAYRLHGAPVLMQFSEPLSEAVFRRWTDTMFLRRGRFRLWGNPIQVGPSHIHVYGVDRHLWQPVYLEFTRRHVVAVLPKGTCGNTIHRLVTNVQRFVDPAVKTWIGDEEYAAIIQRSFTSGHQE